MDKKHMPRGIALLGAIGAGKTTVADHLAPHSTVINFADTLKELLVGLGFPPESLYGTQEEKMQPIQSMGGVSGRMAARVVGTEVFREGLRVAFASIKGINPEAEWIVSPWVHSVRAKIERAIANGKFVVVGDVRFPDELALMKELDILPVEIVRPNNPFATHASTHASDQSLTHDGVIIQNNGTLEDLYARVDEVINS